MRRLVISMTAAVALTLTGCGSESDSPAADDSSAPAAAPSESSSSPAAEGSEDAEETQEGSAEAEETSEEEAPAAEAAQDFGQKHTWDDGVAVTVGEFKEHKPSEYFSSMEEWDKYVVSEVVLENGTDAALDAMMVNFQATTGDAEAEAIFDSPKIDFPTAKVQPGKTLKFNIGFGVREGEEFVLTVTNLNDLMSEDLTLSTELR